MPVTYDEQEGCAEIHFEGEIDLLNMNELKDVLLSAQLKRLNIILNMSAVSYLDSSGIGMLLMIKKNQATNGRSLSVVNIPDKLKKILSTSTVDSLLS